ncbi:hypothetical protein [Actinophytocola sp.]|uniref:hypothetical protein n=1 Tax=Actinophytocola sp. TaxID=1872138 RepID=UPI002ED1929B
MTQTESPVPRAAPHNQAQDRALDRHQRRSDRTRMVRIVCTIVNVLCGLFAVVLVFAAAVSLGFNELFTPADVKIRVLLNDGFAAIVWLALGTVVTSLIRRFALPDPRELMRQRQA